MGSHNGHHRVRELDALQDLGPDHRMDFHFFEFRAGELARLRNDVLGHRELADIVQDRGRPQRFQFQRR
jgi:hypothetical protein